jgi:hypothetical protein
LHTSPGLQAAAAKATQPEHFLFWSRIFHRGNFRSWLVLSLTKSRTMNGKPALRQAQGERTGVSFSENIFCSYGV